MNNENNKTPPLNIISSIIVFFTLVLGTVCLKSQTYITEPSFVLLTLASLFVSLFICFSNRVHTLEVAKCKLILKETKETETSIKDLAKAILLVTETSNHGIMLESFDGGAQNSAIAKLRELTT